MSSSRKRIANSKKNSSNKSNSSKASSEEESKVSNRRGELPAGSPSSPGPSKASLQRIKSRSVHESSSSSSSSDSSTESTSSSESTTSSTSSSSGESPDPSKRKRRKFPPVDVIKSSKEFPIVHDDAAVISSSSPRTRRSSLPQRPSASTSDIPSRARRSSLSRTAQQDKALLVRLKDAIIPVLLKTMGPSYCHIDELSQALIDTWPSTSHPMPQGFTVATLREPLREHVLSDPLFKPLDDMFYTTNRSRRAARDKSAPRDLKKRPRPPPKRAQQSSDKDSAIEDEKGNWICCDSCGNWLKAEDDGIEDISIYDDNNPNHLDYFCPSCREKDKKQTSKSRSKNSVADNRKVRRTKNDDKKTPSPTVSPLQSDSSDDEIAGDLGVDRLGLLFKALAKQFQSDRKRLTELRSFEEKIYSERSEQQRHLMEQFLQAKRLAKRNLRQEIVKIEEQITLQLHEIFER